MRRNVNLLRLFGNMYIVVILLYIAFTYYVLLYQNTLKAPDKTVFTIIHIVFMHVCLLLLLTSFLQTIISDPGKVPLFWGFFLDDPDHKRRRYCLICHIFKPERSHHCSACNRCVLNMDHHCPWLNNCVGFYNRKFFLLLLFYAIVLKLEISIYYLTTWIENIILVFDTKFHTEFNPHYLTIISYLVNTGMLIVISMFFRFHITLIMNNMTTIEHMDRRRATEGRNDTFDMGVYYNFIQIFGKNPWLWFIPVFLTSGKPVGDGVVWPQKPSNAQRYEIDMSIRNVTANKEGSDQGSNRKDKVSPMKPDSQTLSARNQTSFATAGQPHHTPNQHSNEHNGPGFNNLSSRDAGNGYVAPNAMQSSDRGKPAFPGSDGRGFNIGGGSFGGAQSFDQAQQRNFR